MQQVGYRLGRGDLISIGKSIAIAAGGWLTVFISNSVIPILDDGSVTGGLAVAVASVVVNIIRKYLDGVVE